ncbi:NrfD/PsrC family molybdoenzyme membrane anchor subunit [Pararhodobacter sp.]|jgi:protein NrfD|uniref:NrfD/PsrC family molybdoenzyme membrane anchor subunit n=1 Tax=Pararhodobacter sp. TaxID=2127056 RepID=UPI002FDDDD23
MTRHDPHTLPDWQGETYYGQPGLKYPHWDWKVSGYIAVAGTAGAAQALATLGSLQDPDGMGPARRGARLMALTGTVAGAALLIADLKTPQRFHNMLRILRPTSPMSFGSYIFGGFGGASLLSALADLPASAGLRPLRLLGRAGQLVSGVGGAGVATYTAALVSATSNPYWAAAPRALGAQFAGVAVAMGAAALALWERLGGRDTTARRFEKVAAVATLAHLGASAALDERMQETGVHETIRDATPHRRLKVSTWLVAGALPLVGYAVGSAMGGRGRGAAIAGSCAVLAGGMLMRHGLLETGKAAVERPEAGFTLAQPAGRKP